MMAKARPKGSVKYERVRPDHEEVDTDGNRHTNGDVIIQVGEKFSYESDGTDTGLSVADMETLIGQGYWKVAGKDD